MSAADRARRYRRRQSRGRRCYAIEIPDPVVEMMIEAGRLTDDQAADRAHVALEAQAMVEEYARQLAGQRIRHA